MDKEIMGKICCKNKLKLILFALLFLNLSTSDKILSETKDLDLFDRGYNYYLSYQPDRAAEDFKTFLNKFPDNSTNDAVMFWLGKSLIQLKQYQDAENIFNELIKKFPDSPFTLYAKQEIHEIIEIKKTGNTQNIIVKKDSIPLKDVTTDKSEILEQEKKNMVLLKEKLDTLEADKNIISDKNTVTSELEKTRKYSLELQEKIKKLEEEKRIGKLHNKFFSTTGVGTTVENARKIGRHIASELKEDGVSGVILTST